ncbi:MAG: hypothetical protein KatS3mg039_1679 [Candidatus Kapaibacterium sp.]|nr:MAG: hypothetical protein KatS3mg039_1679 [Candidatus Kapabacteria bacterium]
MRRIAWILGVLLLVASVPARSDCVDPNVVTGWVRLDHHTIVLYQNGESYAVVKIPYCWIYPNSTIRFGRGMLCPYGQLWVDNQACMATQICRLDSY